MGQMSRPDSEMRRDAAAVDPNLTKQEQHDAKYRAAPSGGGIPGYDPTKVQAAQQEAGFGDGATPAGAVFAKGPDASASPPMQAPSAVTIPYRARMLRTLPISRGTLALGIKEAALEY